MSENPSPQEQEENTTPESGKKRPTAVLVIGALIFLGLVIAGLFLPPISLGERLGLGGEDTPAEGDTTTAVADGQVGIPGEIEVALSGGTANSTLR